MSDWTVVRLVADREIRERLRSRALLISTVFSVVVLGAVVAVAAATNGDDRPAFALGVAGPRAGEVAATAEDLAGDAVELDVVEVADRADAERRLADDDLDAALVDDTIVVQDEADAQLAALLQAANREVALAEALASTGVTADRVAAASPEPLPTDAVDSDDARDERRGLASIATVLLYAQLLGFGYWVASGIVEEKSSRVVELLLAKTRAGPLLAGKILGVGAVGLGQFVVFVAAGLGMALATGGVDLPPGTAGVAAAAVGWFLAGYALYACLFAMAGAVASRAEELQGTTTPITVVVMLAFFAGVIASNDPDGPMARVTGLVPLTAPLVMPVRMAAGTVAAWEVALAVAFVAGTIALVVRLSARIYSGGVLATRGRLTYRAALARAEG